MDIQTLRTFFMWCTIINGSVFLIWTIFFITTPNLIYRLQNKLFPIPRENYDIILYSFLGLFKLIFIVFNLTPYIALVIMG